MALEAGVGADTPAIFQSGSIPTLSVMSVEVGGGEVLLEVSVDRTGAVSSIRPLRETATFTERMTQAVKTWHFTPATKPGGPATETVDAKVLVAGIFRRPAVIGVTLGEPIRDVAGASPEIVFPTEIVTPPHPPGAINPGVVLVEVRVNAEGGVADATIRMSSPAFDSAALNASRQWKFRPAKSHGANALSVAYIVFGFPVPKG
jgi:TonB family protein